MTSEIGSRIVSFQYEWHVASEGAEDSLAVIPTCSLFGDGRISLSGPVKRLLQPDGSLLPRYPQYRFQTHLDIFIPGCPGRNTDTHGRMFLPNCAAAPADAFLLETLNNT